MPLKEALESAAVLLSIVNALILIQNFIRDRPSLAVDPIHPGVYQWWFEIPSEDFKGMPTRRYGFLVYVGTANRGLRKVALKSWRLFIRVHAQKGMQEPKPLTIPKPLLRIGDHTKAFSVLGIKGERISSGETTVEPGCSISGWAYFHAAYYGDPKWSPIVENDAIKADFTVRDILGGRAKTRITFRKENLSHIEEIVPGIRDVV